MPPVPRIDDELNRSTGRVFASEQKQNADRLVQAATVLASDFAFREAIATGAGATVESALENHGACQGSGRTVSSIYRAWWFNDTLRVGAPPRPFEYQALIAQARSVGQAAAIQMLDQRVLQLVAVPVQAPLTIGWIVIGFSVDQPLATELRTLTGLQVSFGIEQDGQWNVSPQPSSGAGSDFGIAPAPPYTLALVTRVLAMPEQHQLRVVPLGESGTPAHVAVLQRPIDDAMGSFRNLSAKLVVLGLFSLALSITGSVLICCRRHHQTDRCTAGDGQTHTPRRLLHTDRNPSRR